VKFPTFIGEQRLGMGACDLLRYRTQRNIINISFLKVASAASRLYRLKRLNGVILDFIQERVKIVRTGRQ